MDSIQITQESSSFNDGIEARIAQLSALHSQALHESEYSYAQELESDISGLFEQKKFF
jgi:hypothetical protein